MGATESYHRQHGLTCICAGTERWLPTSVDTIKRFVDSAIPVADKKFHGNIINKNVVYALQYCQYLEKTLRETLPTSVITAQHIKSYNLHVVATVEATLEYVLRADYGYNKKRLQAADIEKEWRNRSAINIDQLLAEFSSVLTARNRVHLGKHEDDPQSIWRDTSYNFFLEQGPQPSATLLKIFLQSVLFETAGNRAKVLAAFSADLPEVRLRRSARPSPLG